MLTVLLQPATAGVCYPFDVATPAWIGKDNTGGSNCATGFYNNGCADTNGGSTSTCQQCPEGKIELLIFLRFQLHNVSRDIMPRRIMVSAWLKFVLSLH